MAATILCLGYHEACESFMKVQFRRCAYFEAKRKPQNMAWQHTFPLLTYPGINNLKQQTAFRYLKNIKCWNKLIFTLLRSEFRASLKYSTNE